MSKEITKEEAFNTITQNMWIGNPLDIKHMRTLCNLCSFQEPIYLFQDYAGRTYCKECYDKWVSKIKTTKETKSTGVKGFKHEWI